MGFAEDRFFDYLRSNLDLLKCINVNEMLNELRGTFTIATGEQLDRHWEREGNTNTLFNFVNNLRRRDNWVNHLLKALWNCEHRDLCYRLQDTYRSFKPNKVWEPPHSPQSLPLNPSDHSQLDSLRGNLSLPNQLNPSSPELQLGPPVAPSPSRVQPQESSDPSTRPRAPTPQSFESAQALPHAVERLDEVDTRTAADGISKIPVAETSPFSVFVESNGVLSEDIAMKPPLQEISENPEVVHSLEQRSSVVNTPRKVAVNDLPHTPMIREVVGSDASSPSSSPSSSMGEVNKAYLPPQEREVPGYPQVTSTPPPGQQYTANAISKRHPMEPVPNPSVQPSSCRPTNVDKPGVLNSGAGFADVTRDEVAPLSRVLELEISGESSNWGSQCSSSSQSPAARASKGSPPPRDVLPTSTPRNVSSGSTPEKRPEENEDPRQASSSLHSRKPNRQQPEENSFELSNDLSCYRLQFNEVPSVDLMSGNSAPEQSTTKTSGTRETSDSKANQGEEKPRESNLHNPLVISLSVAVVCLSLYIAWLKYKK